MTHVKVNFVQGNLSNSAAAEDRQKAKLAKMINLQKMLLPKSDAYSGDGALIDPPLEVVDYKYYPRMSA